MERVNGVLVASVAAALLLVALRLFSPSTVPSPSAMSAETRRAREVTDRSLPPGAARSGARSARAGDQPGSEIPPGDDERRPPRDRSVRRGGSPDLIAGVERRRSLLSGSAAGARPSADGVVGGGGEGTIPGRIGAVPSARAPGRDVPPSATDSSGRHVLEFVDQPNPESSNQGPEVLLRMPFNGDINPEVGGGSITADGLVSSGGEVRFPDDAQLSIPIGSNVNSDAGTISMQVRPDWAGSDETNNSLVAIRDENVWENSLAIVKNYGALRFIIHDSAGVERNVNIPIEDWAPGESRRITATWDNSSMTLYVDGVQVGQAPLDHPLNFRDSTPMHIGSDFPTSSYVGADGTIADFTVYARALGPDEVAVR